MELKGVCEKGRRVTAIGVFMHSQDGTVCHHKKTLQLFPKNDEKVQERLI